MLVAIGLLGILLIVGVFFGIKRFSSVSNKIDRSKLEKLTEHDKQKIDYMNNIGICFSSEYYSFFVWLIEKNNDNKYIYDNLDRNQAKQVFKYKKDTISNQFQKIEDWKRERGQQELIKHKTIKINYAVIDNNKTKIEKMEQLNKKSQKEKIIFPLYNEKNQIIKIEYFQNNNRGGDLSLELTYDIKYDSENRLTRIIKNSKTPKIFDISYKNNYLDKVKVSLGNITNKEEYVFHYSDAQQLEHIIYKKNIDKPQSQQFDFFILQEKNNQE
ncbi:hypothetical protein CPX_001379 [Candidatus Phytoplasma pruni]|uniref:Uncharacterized protein n=2 Tax=Candidatus Phytoplasma pruni TaxID=479893 RepID=A0A0M1N0V0_9MOLU|nr:hypothetical protein CPX_001379 [Candidatus Phytoplasma pruni]